MRVNDYLSVLMCQLNMILDCNSQDEYLVETDSIDEQIQKAFKLMEEKKPDVTLFPEMAYMPKFEKTYQELSRENRIVVAGSYYQNGINRTVVFQNGSKIEIPKGYASGAEPMARKVQYVPPKEFLETELQKHEFWIKGKKIYIFNCMEYYHLAYYVARDEELKANLFGIFAICSNSNTEVFEQETTVIHNHNESMYTFMLNCVSRYQGKDYGDGKSYIYGPIQYHEQDWLEKEGIETKKTVAHILSLGKNQTAYIYGEFITPERLSRFGRSDNYTNNPKAIMIKTEG